MRSLLPLALVLSLGVPRAEAHPSAEHQLERLDAAIRAQPSDPANYARRGKIYSDDGRLPEALADLRKAESLGDPVLVAYELGVVHYRLGKLGEAQRYFDLFLGRFPDQAPALEYRARVRRDAGDTAGALADFRNYFARVRRPNPGDYVSAAQLLAGADGEGIPAALAMLDQGMERLGVIPQLQHPAIAWERSRDNTSGALVRLRSLEPSLGASPDWKIDMGELLLSAGKMEDARKLLAAAAAQLAELPTTSARVALRKRLDALEAMLRE